MQTTFLFLSIPCYCACVGDADTMLLPKFVLSLLSGNKKDQIETFKTTMCGMISVCDRVFFYGSLN